MIKRATNPKNPFTGQSVEWFDVPTPPPAEVYEERAKSVLSKNESPDVGFSYSVNPYRGCFHGCSYCYARPTHQYIDFGAGIDFERKIVAKVNAPELLEAAFMKPSWKGDRIVFSGVTDCYQPIENSYELTKRCLEVCLRFQNPVTIITKGALVARDAQLLGELAARADAEVFISLAFSDDASARAVEPHTPSPRARLRAMQILHDAGVRVGIAVAPVIPGLNDTQIPELIARAKECGASRAFITLLRLPAEVEGIFFEQLEERLPQRSAKIRHAIMAMKEGQLNRSAFGERMVGTGPRWEAVKWLFTNACRKHGISTGEQRLEAQEEITERTFRRPTAQLDLFGENAGKTR